VIVVICDNDSIHHARAVTVYLQQHPRLELLYARLVRPAITRPSGSGRR
jgi:hypothetical protein